MSVSAHEHSFNYCHLRSDAISTTMTLRAKDLAN